MDDTPKPPLVLDAIGFVVADMGATVDFYRRLGLDFPEVAADANLDELTGHIEAVLPGGMRLMFDTVDVIESFSTYEAPAGGHRMGLAFQCLDPATVDTTYADLMAAGVTSLVEPFDAFWGQRYATVADPNGNPVDLYAALPEA